MKSINIMNFARSYEPRNIETERNLLKTTKEQLDLVNEYGVEATFLLQYDVIANEEFVKMIKERARENIELGFWYEVVEPLTTACGMPYESKRGWKWDWFIKPGFSVSYTLSDREKLIDEAMRKFKEVFGYYPRTVGSWLLDTHTVNYLSEHYDIDAVCYCRDQINTDAYTFIGGYFNQGYYPSRNNYFIPAGSSETQVNVPAFRLLGPDPINNYDYGKYASPECGRGPYTMEVVYPKTTGRDPKITAWYYDNFFNNEDLGFSYVQIGQENSFAMYDIIEPLRMQIEKALKLDGVKIEKMCNTGRAFKEKFKTTPATSVCALNSWDKTDCQSVYYDCKNYTANIMRAEDKIFIRSLYLFDDRLKDYYTDKVCDTFDAVYESLPIVDTAYQKGDTNGGYGIILDESGAHFTATKTGESELTVSWDDKSVTFKEDGVIINNCKPTFTYHMINTKIQSSDTELNYEYKNNKYSLDVIGARITETENTILFEGDKITLTPKRK